MTDSYSQTSVPADWSEFVSRMNEQFFEAMEKNMEAQAEFVEQWSQTVESGDGAAVNVEDSVQGYRRAYEAWMDAADQMVERANDSMQGEDVEFEEFRDIWLNTANKAFKEAMSTTAFAAWTGSSVGQMLEMQQQADEAAEETLHTLGFATEGDAAEIGDRLVELERRQHAVEQKLDRVIEHLEE
ncbi:poly(R)-hydroxyalkanoic acid synthase subunit [Haloarchaeobius sp. HRN-SO-5]|uniref:poly(R)-hydroxyalkanoic acid synthase subunit n=1 Tax=Haloarchaeobius sp. HRN-SO-5 TaxID=3446118 RepID=UPI003EBB7F9D